MEGTNNANWGIILGHPPHKKMPGSLTAGIILG